MSPLMLRVRFPSFFLIFVGLCLPSCNQPVFTIETTGYSSPTFLPLDLSPTPIESSNKTSQPAPKTPTPYQDESTWITPAAVKYTGCQKEFMRRELKQPYQRNQGKARYLLSNDELEEILNLMTIKSLCIPPALGNPFINADWNSQKVPSAKGHMLSLGFENLYHGAGWSDGYVLYSTYDFSMGTEYDTFASKSDYQGVKEKSIPNLIEVDGVGGFIRFQEGLSLGLNPIHKAYIFPFDDFYIAVVYSYGPFEWEQVDSALAMLQTGEVPINQAQDSSLIDNLALSIQFLQSR